MAASAILHLRDEVPEVGTVFTTHATTLGRSLAANRADPKMYQELPSIDPTALASELGVVAKHNQREVILRKLRADQFCKSEGNLFGRRDAVFSVENHAVADVKHEDRCARRHVFSLVHLEIFFLEIEFIDAIPAHGVRECGGQIDIGGMLAKGPFLGFAQPVDTVAGVRSFVHPSRGFPERGKDLPEGVLSDFLNSFGREHRHFLHFLDDSLLHISPC